MAGDGADTVRRMKLWPSALRPALCAALLYCVFGLRAETYQLVLSNEDTAFSVKSGGWGLDKTGTFLHSFKFGAPGPGTGAGLAVWTIDAVPAGTYDVEFYVDNGNYAATAEYVVESDDGLTTAVRSQNYVATGWHPLGTFRFAYAGRITQTDHWTGAGTKVIADTLRLALRGNPVAPTTDVDEPAISMCIDDLGALNPADPSSYTAQLFAAAPDFAYAVMPSQTYGTATLQAAAARGIETLCHQPMQYVGQPDTNPADPQRLYVGMTDAQVLAALRANINAMAPYTIGVNNHQGSRFSQYAHGMALVAGELATRKQFYYDSRTIADSVGFDECKRAGILTAERDLFIDGNTTAETVAWIMALAQRAKYAPNYPSLGIGHQRTYTVPGLLQAVTDLQTTGVALRRLSRSMEYVVEVGAVPPGAQIRTTGVWETTSTDMIARECEDGDSLVATGLDLTGSVEFVPNLPVAGWYRVFVGYAADSQNSPRVMSWVAAANGAHLFEINQSVEGNRWHFVGRYPFATGTAGFVHLDNSLSYHPEWMARADCVKFVYDGPFASNVEGWRGYE